MYWRSEDEEEGEFERYPMTPEGVRRFREKLDVETEVAVEATGTSKYFYDQVVGASKKVRVINPLQFKIISESVKKTDREDARVIAKYLSKGLIPEVRVMGKELRELRSLIQMRDKLVKLRNSLKHKMHGFLMKHGIQSRRKMFSSAKSLEEVLKAPVSETSRFELEVIVKQIKSLTEGIKELEGKLKEKGEGLKGQKKLQSITGIGKLSSTIILSLRFLGEFWCGITLKLCEAAVFVCLPLCPVGIQAIIADKVFMFGWDVLGELCDKITRLEELDILFPVDIVFHLVNDCAV